MKPKCSHRIQCTVGCTKISIGRQPYFAYGHQIFEFFWYLFMFFVACLKLGHHLCVLYFVRIHVYVRLHHHISCPRIFRSIGKNRYIPPTLQYGRFIISSQVHSDIVPLIQIETTYRDHMRYKLNKQIIWDNTILIILRRDNDGLYLDERGYNQNNTTRTNLDSLSKYRKIYYILFVSQQWEVAILLW